MTIPLWLSGSLELFLYNSIYSCHIFLISFLLDLYHSVLYCAHLCMKCSLDISNFVEEISSFFSILSFPSTSCFVRIRMLSYLYLLFSGNLHSVGHIFPFLLCLSLLFFSQLSVRPPQIPFCLFELLFLGDDVDHLQYNVTNLCP